MLSRRGVVIAAIVTLGSLAFFVGGAIWSFVWTLLRGW